MRLAFVLPDFYLHDEDRRADAPEWALLAEQLKFARCQSLPGDWRDWLAMQFLVRPAHASIRSSPLVSLAGQIWGRRAESLSDPPAACWFAVPVHCRAGMDHVLLDGRGCLRLEDHEITEVLACFARDFAGTGWQLRASGDGHLLLAAMSPVEPTATVAPERCLGRNLISVLPSGPGAARLRALSGELELWLFGLKLNRDRVKRGLLTITQLWCWDRSCPAAWFEPIATDRPRASVRILGRDVVAAMLAHVHGGVLSSAMPTGELPMGSVPKDLTVVLLPMQEVDAPGCAQIIDQWLGPARQKLHSGGLRALQVLANDRLFTLGKLDHWRVWRRQRGHFSVLGA